MNLSLGWVRSVHQEGAPGPWLVRLAEARIPAGSWPVVPSGAGSGVLASGSGGLSRLECQCGGCRCRPDTGIVGICVSRTVRSGQRCSQDPPILWAVRGFKWEMMRQKYGRVRPAVPWEWRKRLLWEPGKGSPGGRVAALLWGKGLPSVDTVPLGLLSPPVPAPHPPSAEPMSL